MTLYVIPCSLSNASCDNNSLTPLTPPPSLFSSISAVVCACYRKREAALFVIIPRFDIHKLIEWMIDRLVIHWLIDWLIQGRGENYSNTLEFYSKVSRPFCRPLKLPICSVYKKMSNGLLHLRNHRQRKWCHFKSQNHVTYKLMSRDYPRSVSLRRIAICKKSFRSS